MKKLYKALLLVCVSILIVSGYKLMTYYKEDQRYIEEFSKLSEIEELKKTKYYKTEQLHY